MIRTVLVIARKDLRQRLRDRSAIVLGLVAPLGIAALMSSRSKGPKPSTSPWGFSMPITGPWPQR